MKEDLFTALDESLNLLRAGQVTLEECLARYPERAAELHPLLETFLQVQSLPQPASSPAEFVEGKQRMLQALAEKRSREQASDAAFLQRIQSAVGGLGSIGLLRVPALRAAAAVALALVLIAFAGLLIRSWPTAVVQQRATVARVSGTVEVLPAGSEMWQLAAPGEWLEAGDRVRTGRQSAALLEFVDGSTTHLDAETDVTTIQMDSQRAGGNREIILQQWSGRTHNIVQPATEQAARFEIETPAAVIEVRGTEFSVAVEMDGSTDVTVVEGLVDVTAQETTVRVSAGRGVTVLPERPPSATRPAVVDIPTPWPSPSPGITEPAEAQDGPVSDESPELPEPTRTPRPHPTHPPHPTPKPTNTPRPHPTHPVHPTHPPQPTHPPHPTPKPTNTPRPHPTQPPHPTHPPHPTPKPTKTPKP